MENMMTKRMWRAWDDMYHRKEEATKAIEGWEHKEKIQEFHVVGFPSIICQEVVRCSDIQLFTNLEEAIEEVEENNK